MHILIEIFNRKNSSKNLWFVKLCRQLLTKLAIAKKLNKTAYLHGCLYFKDLKLTQEFLFLISHNVN